MDEVAQGAVWTDHTDPILDAAGAPITGGAGLIAVTLWDSAGISQATGVTKVHVSGGMYRLEKTLAANAALRGWGGMMTYSDGSEPSWPQPIKFTVVTPAAAGGTDAAAVATAVLGASLAGASPNTVLSALARFLTVVSAQSPLTRMASVPITIRRGDLFVYPFLLATQSGGDLDLTGKTVRMHVKPQKPSNPTDDLDDATTISGMTFWWKHDGTTVVSSNGLSCDDPTSGIITLTILPALTTTFVTMRGLPYEIQVRASDTEVWTTVEGSVSVEPDLIRQTTVP